MKKDFEKDDRVRGYTKSRLQSMLLDILREFLYHKKKNTTL